MSLPISLAFAQDINRSQIVHVMLRLHGWRVPSATPKNTTWSTLQLTITETTKRQSSEYYVHNDFTHFIIFPYISLFPSSLFDWRPCPPKAASWAVTSHVGNACTAAVNVCLSFDGPVLHQLRLIESVSHYPIEFLVFVSSSQGHPK